MHTRNWGLSKTKKYQMFTSAIHQDVSQLPTSREPLISVAVLGTGPGAALTLASPPVGFPVQTVGSLDDGLSLERTPSEQPHLAQDIS